MCADETPAPAATITPYLDGPLLVRGDFALLTPDGRQIEKGRGTVALCRCGKSAIKPFCDGTHKVINFRAESDRTDTARTDTARTDTARTDSDRSG